MKIFTILDRFVVSHALVESHNNDRYISVGSGMSTGKLAISKEFDDQIEIENGEIKGGENECFYLIPEKNEDKDSCIIVVKITAHSALGTNFKGDVIGSLNDSPVYGEFPGSIIRKGFSYAGSLRSEHIIAIVPNGKIFTLSRDRFCKDVRFFCFNGSEIIVKGK